MSIIEVNSELDFTIDLETEQEQEEKIVTEAIQAEPEISWEKIEDEWFEFGSEFLTF